MMPVHIITQHICFPSWPHLVIMANMKLRAAPFPLPTHQIPQPGQWPCTSEFDAEITFWSIPLVQEFKEQEKSMSGAVGALRWVINWTFLLETRVCVLFVLKFCSVSKLACATYVTYYVPSVTRMIFPQLQLLDIIISPKIIICHNMWTVEV